MSDNTVKIRLKFGQAEIDYEGPIPFLKNDLSVLIEEMAGFCKDHSAAPPVEPSASPAKVKVEEASDGDQKFDLSVGTIASRTQAKTGPDLVLAACTYLTLTKKKNTFSRQEILDEMKNAQNHYKQAMLGNLSKHLGSLVKKKFLNQSSQGSYALTATKKAEMESLLAQSS